MEIPPVERRRIIYANTMNQVFDAIKELQDRVPQGDFKAATNRELIPSEGRLLDELKITMTTYGGFVIIDFECVFVPSIARAGLSCWLVIDGDEKMDSQSLCRGGLDPYEWMLTITYLIDLPAGEHTFEISCNWATGDACDIHFRRHRVVELR